MNNAGQSAVGHIHTNHRNRTRARDIRPNPQGPEDRRPHTEPLQPNPAVVIESAINQDHDPR